MTQKKRIKLALKKKNYRGHRSGKGLWHTCLERGIDCFEILEEKMAKYAFAEEILWVYVSNCNAAKACSLLSFGHKLFV